MLLALLLQGASLGLTAAAAPGPFQTFLISQSLSGGWRRGAAIAFAPLLSDPPIVLLILLVLDRLPAPILRGLNIAGSLFVLYLAWGMWRQWQAGPAPDAPGAAQPPSGGLWQGVLMNALSPGLYTFWAFVNGPILLAALRESAWHGAAFLVGFYGMLVGGLLGLAALFHQARRLGPRVVRGLVLASIVILGVFAGLLLWRGVTG